MPPNFLRPREAKSSTERFIQFADGEEEYIVVPYVFSISESLCENRFDNVGGRRHLQLSYAK